MYIYTYDSCVHVILVQSFFGRCIILGGFGRSFEVLKKECWFVFGSCFSLCQMWARAENQQGSLLLLSWCRCREGETLQRWSFNDENFQLPTLPSAWPSRFAWCFFFASLTDRGIVHCVYYSWLVRLYGIHQKTPMSCYGPLLSTTGSCATLL